MRRPRTVGTAAAAALCAVGATAAAAPPDPAQALERTAWMPAQYAAPSGPHAAIPHGADREDALVVASDPAMIAGRRWAAEAHRIAQSTARQTERSGGLSIEWRDAGIGGLAALGLVALVGVAAYAPRTCGAAAASGAPS